MRVDADPFVPSPGHVHDEIRHLRPDPREFEQTLRAFNDKGWRTQKNTSTRNRGRTNVEGLSSGVPVPEFTFPEFQENHLAVSLKLPPCIRQKELSRTFDGIGDGSSLPTILCLG